MCLKIIVTCVTTSEIKIKNKLTNKLLCEFMFSMFSSVFRHSGDIFTLINAWNIR